MAWALTSNEKPRFDSEQLQQARTELEQKQSQKYLDQYISSMKVEITSVDENVKETLQLTPFSHFFQFPTYTSSGNAIKDSPQRGSATVTTAQYQVAIHDESEDPWKMYFKRKIGEYIQQRKNVQTQLAIAEKGQFTTTQEAQKSLTECTKSKSISSTLYKTAHDIMQSILTHRLEQIHVDKEPPPFLKGKVKKETPLSSQAKAKKEPSPSPQAKAKKEIPPSSQAKAKKVPSPSPQAKAKKEPLLSSQGEAKKKTAKPNMNTATLPQKYNYFAGVNVDIDSD